jgi:hypothetical protein
LELELDVSEAGGCGERLGTDVRHCASFDAIAKFALDNVAASASAAAGAAGNRPGDPSPSGHVAARPTSANPAAGGAAAKGGRGGSVVLDFESFRRAPLRPNVAPSQRHTAAAATTAGCQPAFVVGDGGGGAGRQWRRDDGGYADGYADGGYDDDDGGDGADDDEDAAVAAAAALIVKRGMKRPAFTSPARVKRTAGGGGSLFENFRA